MKRVAVNTRLLVPDKMDGIGRFSYETLKRISENHREIEFTFIFDRIIPKEFVFSSNVTCISLFPPARTPILWIWWFELSLRRFINRHDFDLFLSPEGWVPAGLNCPSLAIIHDLNFLHHPENIKWSHRKFLQYFFPRYARRANRIASVSEYSKKDIQNSFDRKESEIDVVYNGANEVFQPISESLQQEVKAKYSQGNPYFIFIGTIHPRKNLDHLLLAFDQFKKNGSPYKLLIVGNKKWWPDSLEKIYQNLKHKKDVLFLGRKSDDELALLLGSASALCYLPYFEGFGIPILEAFQAGVPVICSNQTSMPEIAQDAAILCEPKAVDEICNAMEKLVSNQELREELIKKGSNRASDFSWDRSAELVFSSMKKTWENAS